MVLDIFDNNSAVYKINILRKYNNNNIHSINYNDLLKKILIIFDEMSVSNKEKFCILELWQIFYTSKYFTYDMMEFLDYFIIKL